MSRATQWPNWMQVTVSKYPSTQRLCGPVDGNTSPLSSNLELPFRFLLLPSDDFKSACFFQMEFSQRFSTIFPAFVQDLNLGDFGTPPKYQATIESAPLRICLGRSQVLRRRPSETPMTKQFLSGTISGKLLKLALTLFYH